MPAIWLASAIFRAAAVSTPMFDGKIVYDGMPCAPRDVSSRASASSDARRRPSSFTCTTANTFLPVKSTGLACVFDHVDLNDDEVHAVDAATIAISARLRSGNMIQFSLLGTWNRWELVTKTSP